jgi:hypothetical protein
MIIFDPLSIIIKLGILSKKPFGTKISIKNYILIIQKPSIYQGVLRYFNNDTKYDIENIILPIKIACDIYLKNNKNIPNIKLLFRNAQNGLNMLIKLYKKYPIIIYCLKYANIIIEIYINNLIKNDLLINYNLNIESITDNISTLKKSLSNNSLTLEENNNESNFINSKYKSFNKTSSSNSISDLKKLNNQKSISRVSSINDINKSPSTFSRASSINDNSDINNSQNYELMSGKQRFNKSKDLSLDLLNLQNNIKKNVYRFGATGFFLFDDNNNTLNNNNNTVNYDLNIEKICDEISENLNKVDNYNNLINQTNITIYDNYNYNNSILEEFNKIWTDNKINYIIKLLDNYINSNMLIIKNTIINEMNEIDDIVTDIILNYNNKFI